MNPPDLGVSVGENIRTAEAGGAVASEKDLAILNQWINQAFQDINMAILQYILKNHPNADHNTLRGLLNDRIKHQAQGYQQSQR